MDRDTRSVLTRRMLALLRIVVGVLFMQHGVQKLFGWLGGIDGAGATAELFSIFGLAGILETFGGALLVLGLLTRPVAFLLAGEMAIAFLWKHLPSGVWPILNRGELALLYLFVFAYLAAAGPGPWSLDHVLARRRARLEPVPGSRTGDTPRRRFRRPVAESGTADL